MELSTWVGSTLALIEESKITDLTVALSASAGQSVWRAVATEYVKQLIEETKFSKAATYLISLGKIEKAVQVQLQGRLFRDAFILAKLNKLDDSIINDILSKWADRAAMGGNLAQAAKVVKPIVQCSHKGGCLFSVICHVTMSTRPWRFCGVEMIQSFF